MEPATDETMPDAEAPTAGLPEAVVLGRLHADIYPREIGARLEDVRTFERFVGGFGGNVAVGLARLGVRTAIVSGVGDDGHGRFVTRFLDAEGVDTSWVTIHPTLRTPITFCEIRPPHDFPLLAYRLPSAPDWELTPEQLPRRWIEDAPMVLVSGTSLAIEPSRATTEQALRWRSRRRSVADGRSRRTILDLDWRQTYWPRPAEYPAALERVVPAVDTVIGSDQEFEAAQLNPDDLVAAGVDSVFVKHGPHGASVLTAQGRVDVPGIAIDVLNGLGAGDAFAAAVAWGLLRGASTSVILDAANASGAVVASRIACSAAMPTEDEIRDRQIRLAQNAQSAAAVRAEHHVVVAPDAGAQEPG